MHYISFVKLLGNPLRTNSLRHNENVLVLADEESHRSAIRNQVIKLK